MIFDSLAVTYDKDFSLSLIGKAQRDIVRKYVTRKVRQKENKIFEINCGTGDDAIYFAGQGHEIYATDLSPVMLDKARKKSLHYPQIRIEEMDIRNAKAPADESFDVLFSNFGGLNCIAPGDWEKFISFAHETLSPGGEIFLVIMPDRNAWESLYFFFKGKKRRRKSHTAVPFGDIEIHYYSPRFVKARFHKSFQHIKTVPVGFFIPPGFMENFFTNHSFLFRILCTAENIFRPILPARFSDHYLIHLKKY